MTYDQPQPIPEEMLKTCQACGSATEERGSIATSAPQLGSDGAGLLFDEPRVLCGPCSPPWTPIVKD